MIAGPNENRWRRMLVHLGLGLLAGTAFLWFSLRHADPRAVLAVMRGINDGWAAIAVLFYAGTLALRLARWRLLLYQGVALPVRRVGTALTVGYGANFLLPARLGELVRLELIHRLAGVARVSALASIGVERLLDGIMVVAALILGLWGANALDGRGGSLLLVAYSGAAIFGTGIFVWIVLRGRFGVHLLRRWPSVGAKFDLLRRALQVISGWRLGAAVLLTVVIYVAEASALWTIARAVGPVLQVDELLVVMGAAALSTLLPSAPGFVGSFQLAFVVSFALFDRSGTEAVATASLMQLFFFAPVAAWAIAWFGSQSVGRLRRRAVAARVESESSSP